MVERLRKEGEKEFDCHDYMSECTVEILLETAMGVSKKTQDRSGFEYAMAVMKQVSEESANYRNQNQRSLEIKKEKKKRASKIVSSFLFLKKFISLSIYVSISFFFLEKFLGNKDILALRCINIRVR